MMKCLTIFATLILGSGCCSAPIQLPIDLPPRPVLAVIPQWEKIPPDAQDAIAVNDLELKTYAKRLEARIKQHNESIQ